MTNKILWNLAYHDCPFPPGRGWMITNELPAGPALKQQRRGAGQMETVRMSALRSSQIKINNPAVVIMAPLLIGVIPRN
jgi:hypothetical protein